MVISENTLKVLRNFSTINPSVMIEEGKTIRATSIQRDIQVIANLEDEFPQQFAIYDLSEFCNVLGLVDDPEINFEDGYLTVRDGAGRTTIKYLFSSPELVPHPNEIKVDMSEAEVQFEITGEDLRQIKKAASVLGYDQMRMQQKDGVLNVSVTDGEDQGANSFAIDVSTVLTSSKDFDIYFNVNNIKLMEGDYDVKISSKMISRWSNKEGTLTYFISPKSETTI
jgi:hypothetical protein